MFDEKCMNEKNKKGVLFLFLKHNYLQLELRDVIFYDKTLENDIKLSINFMLTHLTVQVSMIYLYRM